MKNLVILILLATTAFAQEGRVIKLQDSNEFSVGSILSNNGVGAKMDMSMEMISDNDMYYVCTQGSVGGVSKSGLISNISLEAGVRIFDMSDKNYLGERVENSKIFLIATPYTVENSFLIKDGKGLIQDIGLMMYSPDYAGGSKMKLTYSPIGLQGNINGVNGIDNKIKLKNSFKVNVDWNWNKKVSSQWSMTTAPNSKTLDGNGEYHYGSLEAGISCVIADDLKGALSNHNLNLFVNAGFEGLNHIRQDGKNVENQSSNNSQETVYVNIGIAIKSKRK